MNKEVMPLSRHILSGSREFSNCGPKQGVLYWLFSQKAKNAGVNEQSLKPRTLVLAFQCFINCQAWCRTYQGRKRKCNLFIYTIFQEGDTFGMKAILPCGPLNIKHMKNKLLQKIYKNLQTITRKTLDFNSFKPNGISRFYQLDQFISVSRVVSLYFLVIQVLIEYSVSKQRRP